MLIVIVGLAVFVFLPVGRWLHPSMTLHTCLQNAQDLRANAAVRIAGLDVGIVRSVRAQPDNRECPAAVEMVLNPGYELRIPRDSVVLVQKAGLFGGTFVAIDSTSASGPAIEDHGTLMSRTAEDLSPEKVLELLDRLKRLEASCSSSPENAEKHKK